MLLIFYCTLLMVAALSMGNENGREAEEDREKVDESFDSPIYGPSNYFRPDALNEKSAYNVPAPVLPSSYSGYLTSLGYGLPYSYGPYSRYGAAPYSVPPAYGAFYGNPALMSALMSSLGYAGYGGPYFGRSVHPGFGYGFPNYYSGLTYPPSDIRRAQAPVGVAPAPVVGIAPSIPRSAPLSAVAPPVPAFPAFPNSLPGVAASLTGVLPSSRIYSPVRGKDGSIRYAPADPQSLY